MEQVSTVNRKQLAQGLRVEIEQQLRDKKNQVMTMAKEAVEASDNVKVLLALKEMHPQLSTIFDAGITHLVEEVQRAATKGMPTYLDYDNRQILRGKLELMSDDELRSYSLEELASLLRSQITT